MADDDGILTRLGRWLDKDPARKSMAEVAVDELEKKEPELKTYIDAAAELAGMTAKPKIHVEGGESVHEAPQAPVTPSIPRTRKDPKLLEI